jgi:hypothetical protein
MSERLAAGGLLALIACIGCDLGEADVVMRTPDPGPTITSPQGEDAASDSMPHDDGPVPDASPTDGISTAKDTRDTPNAGPDAGLAKDSADAPSPVDALAERISTEGGSLDEADDDCDGQDFVFCADFEDGAVGWMSTSETWAVTDDPYAAQPNQVFAPAGPAASGAYVAGGAWQDMTLEVRVRVTSFGQSSSSNRAEAYARYQDSGHFYAISLRGDGKLGLRRNSSGFGPVVDVAVGENEWHVLKIKVSGPKDDVAVEGYLDGTLLVTANDVDGALSSALGTAGVGIYGETLAVFDDVKVSSP